MSRGLVCEARHGLSSVLIIWPLGGRQNWELGANNMTSGYILSAYLLFFKKAAIHGINCTASEVIRK